MRSMSGFMLVKRGRWPSKAATSHVHADVLSPIAASACLPQSLPSFAAENLDGHSQCYVWRSSCILAY